MTRFNHRSSWRKRLSVSVAVLCFRVELFLTPYDGRTIDVPYERLPEGEPTGAYDLSRTGVTQGRHLLSTGALRHPDRSISCSHVHPTYTQEVDRTEKLFPELEKAGYDWVFAAGPRKKHGCLIAFRKDAYECVRRRMVTYDEEDVRDADTEAGRRGSSFRTKNIGSLVALRSLRADGDGVIVATTHLFWHPAYVGARLRYRTLR